MSNPVLFIQNQKALETAGFTAASFNALTPEQTTQVLAAVKGASSPTTPQLFAEEEASAPAGTSAAAKFDIEGDSVYLNVTVEIAGQKFRLQGVKLTEKSNCMTGWDKAAKEFTKEQPDVMSVIDMVRTHGAAVVNEHATFDVRLGKAGEAATEKRDPLAELLAAKLAAQTA